MPGRADKKCTIQYYIRRNRMGDRSTVKVLEAAFAKTDWLDAEIGAYNPAVDDVHLSIERVDGSAT